MPLDSNKSLLMFWHVTEGFYLCVMRWIIQPKSLSYDFLLRFYLIHFLNISLTINVFQAEVKQVFFLPLQLGQGKGESRELCRMCPEPRESLTQLLCSQWHFAGPRQQNSNIQDKGKAHWGGRRLVLRTSGMEEGDKLRGKTDVTGSCGLRRQWGLVGETQWIKTPRWTPLVMLAEVHKYI